MFSFPLSMRATTEQDSFERNEPMKRMLNKQVLSRRPRGLRNQRPRKGGEQNFLLIWAMIKNCVKHVAERAWQILVKSFWDAYFERVWPK
jgi:hypothetical protein